MTEVKSQPHGQAADGFIYDANSTAVTSYRELFRDRNLTEEAALGSVINVHNILLEGGTPAISEAEKTGFEGILEIIRANIKDQNRRNNETPGKPNEGDAPVNDESHAAPEQGPHGSGEAENSPAE